MEMIGSPLGRFKGNRPVPIHSLCFGHKRVHLKAFCSSDPHSGLPRCTNLLSGEPHPGKIRLPHQGACYREYFFPMECRLSDRFYRPMPLLEYCHRQSKLFHQRLLSACRRPGVRLRFNSRSSPGSANGYMLNPRQKKKSQMIGIEPSSDGLRIRHAITLEWGLICPKSNKAVVK